MRTLLLSLAFLITTLATASSQSQMPLFESGSTVCFVGNSITQDGRYHNIIKAFYATRYPQLKVNFVGCGIGGDVTSQMISRFEGDVMRHNPDYAFLMTGMNDMSAALFREGLELTDDLEAKRAAMHKRYEQLTEKLVKMMLERGVKPILITPTIYDETVKLPVVSHPGKCAALLKCAEHICNLAKRYELPVVDLTQFMLDINIEAQRNDPSFTIVSKDRVHPDYCGHFIMAYRIINTLMAESGEVSTIDLNAKGKSEFSFSHKASSLPFPVVEQYESALAFVPFMEQLNREMLRVRGLKRGRYELSIDGVVVDTISSAELNEGVNIASNSRTPQYQQAAKVFELVQLYHQKHAVMRAIANVDFKRLANYKGEDSFEAKRIYLDEGVEQSRGKSWYGSGKRIVNTYYEYKPQEDKVVAEMAQLQDEIYSLNVPREHHYSLRRMRE